MKRTLTLLMLLLALLALLVLPAAAADLPRLVDNADLLMADDAEALLADLDSRSEALQFDIVIVTVDSLDGETPRNYAEDFFWYNNYGLGEDRDGALLLVAMDTRDWYIATHGFGITAITPAGREAMVDRFLPQLSNAEYAAAFSTFAEECEDYVNQARNGSAYDTGNLPDEPFEAPGFLWVVACLLFGGVLYLAADPPPPLLGRQAAAAYEPLYKVDGLVLNDELVVRGMDRDATGMFVPFAFGKDGAPRASAKLASLEKLGNIEKHLDALVVEMARGLYAGEIDAVPLRTAAHCPCDVCDYRPVCLHEDGRGETSVQAPKDVFETRADACKAQGEGNI